MTAQPLDPKSDETVAEAIVKLSEGFAALTKTGLNRRAIILLLQDITGVPKRQIDAVLAAIPQLKTQYLVRK